MVPQYKLTYFNGLGLAEPIRLILTYSSVPFEDVRIPHDQWEEVKKTTPYGKLPILEIDGKVMNQSKAIARYLAKKYNLTGNDEWDAYQCDAIVDTLNDLLLELSKWHSCEDTEKKKELEAKFKTESLPSYLKIFEKTAAKNDSYLVTSKLTWADLYVVCIFDSMKLHMKEDVCKDFPELKKLKEKVHSIPKIAAWVAKRQVTDF